MLVQHSYDSRFVSMMERLKKQYSEKMFETSGIGDRQLDINSFSKNFFGDDGNTADKSIDANANVNEKSVSGWMTESTKSIMKLNAYYQLWKDALKKHGIKRANKMIESEIIGSIRIHDLWLWNKPYSYYRETPIYIRINDGDTKIVSMKQLFDLYAEFVEILPDRETIDLKNVYKTVDYSDVRDLTGSKGRHPYKSSDKPTASVKEVHNIEILDGDGNWTALECVLRHKREVNMIAIQLNNGDHTIVTADHPVILESGDEIRAELLQVGDKVKLGDSSVFHDVQEYIDVNKDFAYFMGFITGDGNVEFYSNNNNLLNTDICINISKFESGITIYQSDIQNSKIYECVKRLVPDTKLFRKSVINNENMISLSNPIIKLIMSKYFNVDYTNSSYTKNVPINVLSWNRDSKLAYISGLIDSEGTVDNRGSCNIKMKAYGIMNSLDEILKSCDITVTSKGFCNNEFDGLCYIVFDGVNELKDYSTKYSNVDTIICKDQSHDTRILDNSIKKISVFDPNNIANAYNLNGEEWGYVYDITTKSHTFYSGGMTQHNCWAASLDLLVSQGMPFQKHPKTREVKHFDSFINVSLQYLCYLSNSIAGAVALPDFFAHAEYFIRKDFGERWFDNPDSVRRINQLFQNWIYSINFSWRSNQSPFTNLSIMDSKWIESLFSMHYNPDFSSVNGENLMKVQRLFVDCVIENKKNNPFTFPVLTACLLYDNETKNFADEEFADWVATINAETGIFNIFTDDNINALSSCCRLRSSLVENNIKEDYTNSFGVGGLSIGSHRVVALNLPQIAYLSENWDEFRHLLEHRIGICQDILDIHRETLTRLINKKFLPLYNYGFMDLNKQYSTVGFVGLFESLEIMGYNILEKEGSDRGMEIIEMINQMNDKRTKNDGFMRNVEQCPSEGSAVDFAKKDNILFDGKQKYKLYSNQYIPLVRHCDMHDRIRLQGIYDSKVGGGSILHVNVSSTMSKQQMLELMLHSVQQGVKYWAVNYGISQCKTCGTTYVGRYEKSACHDAETTKFLRIVGFEVCLDSWSRERRKEYSERQFY